MHEDRPVALSFAKNQKDFRQGGRRNSPEKSGVGIWELPKYENVKCGWSSLRSQSRRNRRSRGEWSGGGEVEGEKGNAKEIIS